MEPFEIYVYCKEIEMKNGKKFKAYETTDTKDKTRLTVAFLQAGDKAPEKSCRIKVTAARMDERKRFPVLRVEHYEITDGEKPITDNTKKYFN